MSWDEFTPLSDSEAQDWSEFTSVDQLTEDTFERTGLDVLDDILGGGLSRATRQNLADPSFDPETYNNPPPSYRQQAMERAQRRADFLRENPMEFEQLGSFDQAILGAGQGVYDVGRSVLGAVDAFGLPSVGITKVPGAREGATQLKEESDELAELTTGPETTLTGDFAQFLSRMIPSIIPSVIGGRMGGFPGAYSMAGAQSGGAVFEDAQDGYLRQGFSPGEARMKAYAPAAIAAAATAGITGAFGQTGVEALSKGLSPQAVRQLLDEPVMALIKGSGKEASEEALDQLSQGIVAKATYEPEKTIGQIVQETLMAAAGGGLLGGMGEGISFGVQSLLDRQRIEDGTDPLGRTPEGIDPTRGSVDEQGQVVPPPLPQEPVIPQQRTAQESAQPSTRLRRGERGIKGAAIKAVESMGVSNDTAKEFVDRWMGNNPQWGSLEEMREKLLLDMKAMGIEPENRTIYRDDVSAMLELGMTAEEAVESVEQARAGNEAEAQAARQRNAERLRKPSARLMPDATRRAIPFPDSATSLQPGKPKAGSLDLKAGDVIIDENLGEVEIINDMGGNLRGGIFEVRFEDGRIRVMDRESLDGLFRPQPYIDANTGERKFSAPATLKQKTARDARIPVDPQQLPAPEISAPAASPQQTIEALRRAEREGRMPDGRPIDRRERVDWLMDESNALKREDKEKGWERIQEASKLARQITADERARVPDDARLVKVEGTNFDVFFHPSVQPGYEGQWQATEMDKEGNPLGHSVHPTLQKALKDRLDHWKQKVTDIRFKRKGGETNGQRSQEGLQEQVVQGVQVAPEAGAETPAPALPFRYEGAFENPRTGAKLHQYTLTQPVADRPVGATVSENFLRENGVTIPPEIPSSATDAPAAAPEPTPAVPERTIKEEREFQGITKKKQVSADEMRRKDILSKKSQRKTKVHHDDIIDFIADGIGKIKSVQAARPGSEGYYGELYKSALRHGSVRSLFTRNQNGQSPDEVLEALRDAGRMPKSATVDDLWEVLDKAGEKRSARVAGSDKETERLNTEEAQATAFAEDAFTKDKKTDEAFPVGQLIQGETVVINKEKFIVRDVEYDLDEDRVVSVTLSDGKKYGTQRVGGQDVIYIDKGSYQPVDAGAAFEVPANPNAQDIPLFNQGDEQLSIGDSEGKPTQKREARGTPSMERMIESSNLPANTKRVWLEWLKTPVMMELDWTQLRLELWDYLQTGVQGARIGRLIMLSQNADAATLPHEMAHVLYDMLPEFDKQTIEMWRKTELKAFGIEHPLMVAGNLSSREFREEVFPELEEKIGADKAFQAYRYINPSEFYAHFISERFAREAFANRNSPPNFWSKVREIFQVAFDAMRRAIGLTPSQDQIYRETLRGTWAQDSEEVIEKIVTFEEQNSFAYTARDAQNAASLAKGPDAKAIEASHQLAQAFDIVEFFNKHGAPKVTTLAQRALRFFEYVGIRAAGENLNGGKGESYRQLKARITDPFQRNWMARFAAVHISNLEGHFKQVIKDGNEAFAKLGGVNFLKKLAKNDMLRTTRDQAKLLDEAAGAMLQVAHKRALQVLKEEAKTDREIAELEGELAAIDDAQRSSSAMSMLMEDMVKVLASTPEGEVALSDPNVQRAEIIRIYRDIKRSTGQPLFNENLMRWASYVISRNAEVRDALWAAQLARNSTVRAQMGPYEKKFLADLEQDPLKTVQRELREAKKRTSAYERARFAYLTLNKEVMSELAKLQSALEAKEVAENILNDPAWKAHRKEVFDDAQVEGTQKPFVAFTDKLLVLPDGREVNVDPEHMKGSKTHFDAVYASYKRAEADLEQWLHDPANTNDPNWGVHRRNLGELQEYLTSLSMLKPADTDRAFGFAMTILQDAIKLAGGRMQDTALKAMSAWGRVKEKAGWWNQRWSSRLMEARRHAIKSHGIKWGVFQQNDIVKANQIWWENVGNILHYSHQRQEGGFKVGDKLPSGWTVTREDLDQLKLQAEAISAGFDVIKDFQITQDTLAQTGLFRKALKGSENMVRRIFNNGLLSFGEEHSLARKAFQEAFRSGDHDAMKAAEERMIRLLNQRWDKIGFALIWDRSADFANNTIFDGEGGAFDVIAREMLANPNAISNFDELIDRIVSLTADVTPEDARKVVLVEWGRIINQWYQTARDDSDSRMVLPVRGKEAKNATTRSRDKALAPYAFYEYGFKDSRSIATFAGALHSAPLDRLVSAMVAMEDDLQRQIDELSDQSDPGKTLKENARARKNGETYDKLKNLDHRLKELRSVMRFITSYDIDQDVDVTFGRTMGVITGALISSVTTTARNFTTGPLYIGRVMNQINGGSVWNYPMGFAYAYIMGGKVFGSVGVSMAKGVGRAIVKIPEAIRQMKRGNFRGAYSIPMRDFIEEVGTNSYMRIKLIKQLVDDGLLFMPDLKQEFQNMVEGSFLYSGRIPARGLSGGAKVAQLFPAALEGTLLAVTKTFAPMAGDLSLNAAVTKVLPHALRDLDLRLREMFKEWKRTKFRTFNFSDVRDPQNILSAKEMFPNQANREKLFNDMKNSFAVAGLNFDEIAARTFSQMEAGNPPKHFLTDEEIKKMAAQAINDVNRPSPTGSPMFFQGNGFWINLLKPFMSWKVRSLQLFNRMLSIPGQSGLSKKALWGMVLLGSVLPMLLINAFLIQPGAEEADRLMKRVLFNQEKSTRQPWERDGAKSQAIGWTVNSMIGIPFVDMAVNGAVNDLPVRASMYPEAVMLSKFRDAQRYVGGVIQTGDPTFRLPEFISGFVPDTRIIFNRLESQSGKRISSNALALMRRHGQTELLREVGEPIAGVNYNELSPYGPRLENAAMNGDLVEFRNIFDEAVARAKEMGRPDPEKAVRQLFSHRNPYDRAFRAKLTEDQKNAFLSKLSDRERALLAEMEERFRMASETVGTTFNTFKGESGTASLGRGRSGRGTLASLSRRGGRSSRGRRSLRLRRGTRNLRRRSRLSRAR